MDRCSRDVDERASAIARTPSRPGSVGEAKRDGLPVIDGTDMIHIMKTIAVSIDEATLEEMDKLVGRLAAGRRGRRTRGGGASRSELVRLAVRQYLAQRRRAERDARDGAALAKNRERLEKQAAALVAEQATP